MRDTTTNWDTENAVKSKDPRIILDTGLTDDYVSGDYSGRGATEKQYAGLPKITLSEVDPLRPSLDLLGECVVPVIDKGNEITTLIANNTMLGREVTVKHGFAGITSADFINLYKGRIHDYNIDETALTYNFRILAAFDDLNKMAFRGISETKLAAPFGMSEFSQVIQADASAGASKNIDLAVWPDNLTVGDVLYIEEGATKEIFTIESLDPANTRIVAANLANSYTTAGGATVDNTRFKADTVSGFLDATVYFNPPQQDGIFVMVGNEIMEQDGTETLNGDPVFQVAATRNNTIIETVKRRHNTDAVVKEVWVLRDDPITLMLNIITTTTGGSNGSGALDFDIGTGSFGSDFGVGMDYELIDFPWFLAIKDAYFGDSGDEIRLIITEPVTAVDVLLDIARSCGLYFVINNEGQLSIRKIVKPNAGMSVKTITDADLVLDENSGLIQGFSWSSGQDRLINEIEYHMDWVPGINKYLTTRIFGLANSKTTYNRVGRHVIQSKSLRNAFANIDSTFIDPLNNQMALRYANPPPYVQFDVKMGNVALEAGDIIQVTSSLLPDIEVGDRTLATELMELTKAEPDFVQNVVHLAGYLYNQENGVSVGSSSTTLAADMTEGTATFDSTDADAIDATNDAHFDNSADAGSTTGTRYIVVVTVIADDTAPVHVNTIDYHIRVGTESGGTLTPASGGDLDTQVGWVGGKGAPGHTFVLTHTFEFVSTAVYDVTLDYNARSGTDASNVATIALTSVTIETDGAAYTETT